MPPKKTHTHTHTKRERELHLRGRRAKAKRRWRAKSPHEPKQERSYKKVKVARSKQWPN